MQSDDVTGRRLRFLFDRDFLSLDTIVNRCVMNQTVGHTLVHLKEETYHELFIKRNESWIWNIGADSSIRRVYKNIYVVMTSVVSISSNSSAYRKREIFFPENRCCRRNTKFVSSFFLCFFCFFFCHISTTTSHRHLFVFNVFLDFC